MGKQKRSPGTYQKIDTVFKRDVNNIIMPYEELVSPELEFLRGCKFDAEEKIDGTNVRLEVKRTVEYATYYENNVDLVVDKTSPVQVTWSVKYKGKTDTAEMPKMLGEFLRTEYPEDKILGCFGLQKIMSVEADLDTLIEKGWITKNENGKDILNLEVIPENYTIYGEGYGARIQKCGARYLANENKFIGFDIKINEWYLLREQRDEILKNLGVPVVPFIGTFTIDEAIEYVRKGFTSLIAEDKTLPAEGLVLRTPIGLKSRKGDRIIFKVKTCDFEKYFNVYKTHDKVEQVPNENYNK